MTTTIVMAMNPALAAAELTMLAHPAMVPAHAPLIVLLHGAGADERDMITLWPQLPLSFTVVSPRAPFGDAAHGYRWYRRDGGHLAGDLTRSRQVIDEVVDSAIKRFDADPARVFLAGFSQGAVMVYEVALREPGRFRGAAVLGGSLFASARAALGTGRAGEAFFIGHGTADPRVPFGAAIAARDALKASGVPTEFHAYAGMGHTTGQPEVNDLSAWLSERAADRKGATVR